MLRIKTVSIAVACATLCVSAVGWAGDSKKKKKEECRSTNPYLVKEELVEGYNHMLFAPSPMKRKFDGVGFVASIDDSDDDDGAIGSDYLATPEWVSYQLNGYYGDSDYAPGWKRPKRWYRNQMFDIERREADTEKRIDDSYKGVGRIYNRGHLASRSDLNRISPKMGCNSHDPANAVPQAAKFNQGIWLGLENYLASLANVHGAIWISAGPIYEGKLRYIHDDGEIPVGIPTALWKTVAWIEEDQLQWRAWIYPNRTPGRQVLSYKTGNCAKDRSYRHTEYLVSLKDIEEKTGLTMFPGMKGEYREEMLEYRHDTMPSVPEDKFIGSCR